MRPESALVSWMVDVQHGLRLTLRRPFFSLAVVTLLALGIGATTAVFSVYRSVLHVPLPYPSPERLVMVWETTDGRLGYGPASGPNFLDWQEQAGSFESLAAFSPGSYNLAGETEPVRAAGGLVTWNIFDVLGVLPEIGRPFTAEEEERAVIIVSHRLWQRFFGGDPRAIGAKVLVNGETHVVIGVMPKGFNVLSPWTLGTPMDLWAPLNPPSAPELRSSHWLLVLGRLADGTSVVQAQREMDTIAAALSTAYPDTNRTQRVRVGPYHEEIAGWARRPLTTLLGAALLVLLIASGNVGGLLITRITAREPEMALRSSLGARPARLAGLVLAENLPLVLIGGAFGALLAHWGLVGLRGIMPPSIGSFVDVGIDPLVLLVAAAFALPASLVFAVVPALAATRASRVGRVAYAGRGGTLQAGRSRTRRVMLVVQLALTLVLANSAALMLVSSGALQRLELGFEPDGVQTGWVSLAGPRYPNLDSHLGFIDELLPRLQSLSGVEWAAVSTKLPLRGGSNGEIMIEGRESDWGDHLGPLAERTLVTPTYHEAMGIRLVAGRFIEEADTGSEFAVAVVNDRLARIAWPDENAVGKRFKLLPTGGWITVVGVVSDVYQWSLEDRTSPEYYIPFSRFPAYWADWERQAKRLFVVTRSNLPTGTLVPAIRLEMAAVDVDLALGDPLTMAEIVDQASRGRRFMTLLIVLFAITGLVLIATGVYAAVSMNVARQTAEIGLRIALGANPRRVVAQFLTSGLRLVLAGVVLGLIGVAAVSRALSLLLFQIHPLEPIVLLAGTIAVIVVGLVATAMPALRAARVDPVDALRSE